jgi:hypothetical protein
VESEGLVGVGELLGERADVDAEDEGLALEEQACGCEADSAAAAGYDDDFVLDAGYRHDFDGIVGVLWLLQGEKELETVDYVIARAVNEGAILLPPDTRLCVLFEKIVYMRPGCLGQEHT